MSSKIKILTLLIVLPLIFYSPIFLFEFGFHNDYTAFYYPKPQNFWPTPETLFPETNHLVLAGRPLGALLLNLQLLFINRVIDLSIARLISLFFLIINAYLLMQFFVKNKFMTELEALILAFCFIMLPSNQLFVIWVTNFVPGIIANLLAIVSYICLDKAKPKNIAIKNFTRKQYAYAIGSILTFLMSLLIYPATATFVFVFTFARIIFTQFSRWKETRIYFIRDILFFSFGMAFYFIVNKFVIFPYLSTGLSLQLIKTGAYEMSFSTNIIDKIFLFIQMSAIVWSGELYLLFHENATVVVLIFMAFVTIFYINKIKKIGFQQYRFSWFLQLSICTLILLLVTNISLLVPKGVTSGQHSWRVMIPYSTIALIALLRLIFHYQKKRNLTHFVWVLLSKFSNHFIIAISGTIAFINLYIIAITANQQLIFVRSKIAAIDLSENSKTKILVIVKFLPSKIEFLLIKNLTFEFRNLSISPVDGLITIALKEHGIKFPVTQNWIEANNLNTETEYVKYIDDTVSVINFNDSIKQTQGKGLPEIIKMSVSLGSSVVGPGSYGLSTVDGYPNSFWEVDQLPQWLQFEFAKGQKITKYSLQSIDTPQETPKEWQVLASNDGKSWIEVDRRKNQVNWLVNEIRAYQINNISNNYRYYRFVFLSANSKLLRINEMKIFTDSRWLENQKN